VLPGRHLGGEPGHLIAVAHDGDATGPSLARRAFEGRSIADGISEAKEKHPRHRP
jgi:hypothetical protein